MGGLGEGEGKYFTSSDPLTHSCSQEKGKQEPTLLLLVVGTPCVTTHCNTFQEDYGL